MNLKRIRNTSSQELTLANGTVILISYSTPVACFIPGDGYHRTEKRWSVTTSRAINAWLRDMHAPAANIQTQPQEWFDALIAIAEGAVFTGNRLGEVA